MAVIAGIQSKSLPCVKQDEVEKSDGDTQSCHGAAQPTQDASYPAPVRASAASAVALVDDSSSRSGTTLHRQPDHDPVHRSPAGEAARKRRRPTTAPSNPAASYASGATSKSDFESCMINWVDAGAALLVQCVVHLYIARSIMCNALQSTRWVFGAIIVCSCCQCLSNTPHSIAICVLRFQVCSTMQTASGNKQRAATTLPA